MSIAELDPDEQAAPHRPTSSPIPTPASELLQALTERARHSIRAHQAVLSLTDGADAAQTLVGLSLSEKYAAWRTYDAKPTGEGIYALVCRTNRPVRMTQAELEAHPSWRGFGREAAKHPPMRGWLAAPLVGRDGRNLGLIQLSDKDVGEFTDDDEALLVLHAQAAALTVENALLENEARAAREALAEQTRFAALNAEVGTILATSDDLRATLGGVAEALVRHLDAAFARIWTLEEEENILRLQASAGQYTNLDGAYSRIPVGKWLVGGVAQERRPLLVNGVADDPRLREPAWAQREGIVAFAGHPLLVEDKLVGVLAVFARRSLSPAVVEALAAVGRSLALGVRRMRTEEAVARLATIVECSEDAIIGMTLAGRITSWNPGAERLYGHTAAEVVGQPILQLIPPDRRGELPRLMEAASRGVHVAPFETVGRAKDGRPIEVSVSVSPIRDREGRVIGASAIARDIRQGKRLEAQYQHAQKMEAVARLAGGVAHDFNNLLTVILGTGELLLAGLSRDDPARPLVADLAHAGERAASLTRQLLTFSRKQVIEPRLLDLNTVVRDAEQLLRRLIGEDIAVTLALDPGLRQVRADPGQIEQVIMNLAVNARDAMPTGGQLTLETGNVYLDEEYARTHPAVGVGRYAMLAVSDTGSGMDEATKARVFEPFFTTKEQGKGTGLGLATVYGIVKGSGGHIWVYSEPGRGSTFKVYLPWAEGKVPSAKSHVGLSRIPTGKETLLLAEDEDAVRALTRHVLTACGYTVLEARNGAEALRLCEHHAGPIQLLVTDVVMPEVSGRQLAERLTQRHPEMRVLFLSGYTDDAVVRHGVLQAEVAFLQKPFTPAALAQKVREVLDRRN
jgi:PAS domain S-box-containing protein